MPKWKREQYMDASGAWRMPEDDYIDYSGCWRKANDFYVDASGAWRAPNDDYIDERVIPNGSSGRRQRRRILP